MSVLILALALFLLSGPAPAHELNHSIAHEEATVIQFKFGDDSYFSYESYEIFPPGETTPFQVGRTDHEGRITFLPDRPGDWRIRAFSEDGHGADLTLAIDGDGLTAESKSSRPNFWIRVLSGLGIIFGIFGLISLFIRRKSK